jgi:hypothetical protein
MFHMRVFKFQLLLSFMSAGMTSIQKWILFAVIFNIISHLFAVIFVSWLFLD